MPRLTEVVKQLLILNVLLFILVSQLLPQGYDNALALYYPDSEFFRPWQLVTYMFMHGDFNHLLFNMFGLYMFGTSLETYWGPKRFLTYYLLCGFGALALHLFILYLELSSLTPGQYQQVMTYPEFNMRGASGAVFGLLAGFGMMFPNQRIMLLIPPIPIKAKYFVLGYAGLELFLGVSNSQPGIAHFAHLGGAICGALIILYWRKTGRL